MGNLNETLKLRSNLEKWGKITIKRWQETLDKKGIKKTGKLAKSFEQKVQQQQSEAMAIFLTFSMHGRFRDMGVGRGVKAYERNQNTANKVGAKRYGANVGYSNVEQTRWYNKPKMSQIHKMREILGIDLGNAVSEELVELSSQVNNQTIYY